MNITSFYVHEMKLFAYLEETLSKSHDLLMNEAVMKMSEFVPWPEKINQGGWTVGGCIWQGETISAHFPMLESVCAQFPELVWNAGYSVMAPGTEIAPHVGYSKKVLRFHYGLIVPEGDVGLRVDGKNYRWHEREAFVFDDTKEHSAWNRTKDPRLVLIMDLKRVG